jgi:GAF domain-containing protein
VAHQGLSPKLHAAVDRLRLGEGFSGTVAATGTPLVVDDVSSDDRLTRLAVREEGLHSLVIAPLSTKGEVVGTIFAQARTQREFSAQDVELLTSIGRQVALAIENAKLFESEQRRAEQFRVIGEVSRRVAAILSPDELLRQLVHLVFESFGYDTVEIGLIDGEDLVFSAGVDRDLDVFVPFRIRVGSEGITGAVAATGQPILVPDVSEDPRYVVVTDTNARSELAVPMAVAGETIGVLNVQSQALDAFDDSDVSAIQSLADQAAIAIENARLFNAELRRAEQFRVISEMGRRITSILDIDQLLDEVVELIRTTFGYDLITVGLIEDGELVFRAGQKSDWGQVPFIPPPVTVGGRGITAWVAEHGESLLVNNVSQDSRYLVWPAAQETCSELAVPVRTKDAMIGVLNVESAVPDAFDESDREVLQLIANQAAVAIDNARNYGRAQQAAVLEERARLARELHDAVTQTLFSASLIAESLPALWEEDEREGRELLHALRQLSRGALAEMRTLLMELRPAALAETGLDELLGQLAEAVAGRTGIPVEVSVRGRCQVPPAVHAALYRIAQESLNNVVKHAHAQRVAVALESSDSAGELSARALLRVCDDGRGFDPRHVPPESLGLDIMRERSEAIGASIEIDSQLGRGTVVTVAWEGDSRA